MFPVVWGEVGGVPSREPPSQDSLCFSGCPWVAAALQQVQIPAGARHIQIELLEKAPHRIGECRVWGRIGRVPESRWDLTDLDKGRQPFLILKSMLNGSTVP